MPPGRGHLQTVSLGGDGCHLGPSVAKLAASRSIVTRLRTDPHGACGVLARICPLDRIGAGLVPASLA